VLVPLIWYGQASGQRMAPVGHRRSQTVYSSPSAGVSAGSSCRAPREWVPGRGSAASYGSGPFRGLFLHHATELKWRRSLCFPCQSLRCKSLGALCKRKAFRRVGNRDATPLARHSGLGTRPDAETAAASCRQCRVRPVNSEIKYGMAASS